MCKVKICGLTREADIVAANRCLPDYVGFVFADSRRKITEETAQRLRAVLDVRIQVVGVFVNQDINLITRLCRQGIIDWVQLHGDEDEAYIQALGDSVPCKIIKAVGVGDSLPALPQAPDYLLFDTVSRQRGGTGVAFDWNALAGYGGKPYFLAGGLHPGNVADAVTALQPYCVDVSSGVETDGYKDMDKMEQFVTTVRELN